MLLKLLLAAFLFLHGAIHASYISPRPAPSPGAPEWPFVLERSWLLTPLGATPEITRLVGLALIATTLASFTAAAAAAVGLTASSIWPAAVTVGAVSSVALLALFFHRWLALGLVIDLALIAVVVLGRWSPDALGS